MAHEQNDHGGRDGDYAWPQQHRLAHNKVDQCMTTAEYPISQQQRQTLSLWSIIFHGDQPATYWQWQVDYIESRTSWKRATVCSYWNRHSGYELTCLTCNASVKTTIPNYHPLISRSQKLGPEALLCLQLHLCVCWGYRPHVLTPWQVQVTMWTCPNGRCTM